MRASAVYDEPPRPRLLPLGEQDPARRPAGGWLPSSERCVEDRGLREEGMLLGHAAPRAAVARECYPQRLPGDGSRRPAGEGVLARHGPLRAAWAGGRERVALVVGAVFVDRLVEPRARLGVRRDGRLGRQGRRPALLARHGHEAAVVGEP